MIGNRSEKNNSLHTLAATFFASPVDRFLTPGRMPGKVNIFDALSTRVVDGSLDIIDTFRKNLVCRPCADPFCLFSNDFFDICNFFCAAIIESEHCSILIRDFPNEMKHTKSGGGQSVDPNDQLLWFFRPKPKAPEHIAFRG